MFSPEYILSPPYFGYFVWYLETFSRLQSHWYIFVSVARHSVALVKASFLTPQLCSFSIIITVAFIVSGLCLGLIYYSWFLYVKSYTDSISVFFMWIFGYCNTTFKATVLSLLYVCDIFVKIKMTIHDENCGSSVLRFLGLSSCVSSVLDTISVFLTHFKTRQLDTSSLIGSFAGLLCLSRSSLSSGWILGLFFYMAVKNVFEILIKIP